VRRNALVSALCALLSANTFLAANTKEIEGLLYKCARANEKSCKKLATAIPELTDQALLAKIALEAMDEQPPRGLPIEQLIDEASLKNIAIKEVLPKLTDQAVLEKIADEAKNLGIRATAVAAMDGSNPALNRLAGDPQALNLLRSAARVKLAIQEPRIRKYFPRIVVAIWVAPLSQAYVDDPFLCSLRSSHCVEHIMLGEAVTFVLSEGGETLAVTKWSTDFPGRTAFPNFEPAPVSIKDLVEQIFHNAVFTQVDLAELSSSAIPEVCQTAVVNLTDQVLLAKSAVEAADWWVRQYAVRRLTDQALLARIADQDEDLDVRKDAQERLADLRNNPK